MLPRTTEATVHDILDGLDPALDARTQMIVTQRIVSMADRVRAQATETVQKRLRSPWRMPREEPVNTDMVVQNGVRFPREILDTLLPPGDMHQVREIFAHLQNPADAESPLYRADTLRPGTYVIALQPPIVTLIDQETRKSQYGSFTGGGQLLVKSVNAEGLLIERSPMFPNEKALLLRWNEAAKILVHPA